MGDFWFKPKTYGYGATPVTWQGWTAVAIYTAVVLTCCAMIAMRGSAYSHVLTSMVVIAVATVAMFAIGIKKTDGPWHWQWGERHDTGKSD